MPNSIRLLLIGLAFAVTSLPAAGAKTPVILDTDIGSDIDDAFALALIINSPELDLLTQLLRPGDPTRGCLR